MTAEYRVETRRTDKHPSGAGDRIPDGDAYVTTSLGAAKLRLDHLVRWFGEVPSSDRWEHRIVSREVTDWAEVES